jgi:hypothetical protein
MISTIRRLHLFSDFFTAGIASHRGIWYVRAGAAPPNAQLNRKYLKGNIL